MSTMPNTFSVTVDTSMTTLPASLNPGTNINVHLLVRMLDNGSNQAACAGSTITFTVSTN